MTATVMDLDACETLEIGRALQEVHIEDLGTFYWHGQSSSFTPSKNNSKRRT
jgi:hypothetical protein